MDIATTVQKYILLRDRKEAIRNSVKEKIAMIDAALDAAEAAILSEFQKTGAEAVKTPYGTAYRTTRTSATVQDWDAVLGFIRENEAWHMLDKRVNKTGVEEYRQEHNDLPPGVNWREEAIINVRRS
jgi:hypothetical protein